VETSKDMEIGRVVAREGFLCSGFGLGNGDGATFEHWVDMRWWFVGKEEIWGARQNCLSSLERLRHVPG
jgi:hypothetical protein